MSHKTQVAYTTMFYNLNQAYSKVFPGRFLSTEYVMMDCEIALKNATEVTWARKQ